MKGNVTGVVMGLVMGNVTGIMMGMGIVHFQDRLDVLDRQILDSASTEPRQLDSSTARAQAPTRAIAELI
jgi:hypothetical protein